MKARVAIATIGGAAVLGLVVGLVLKLGQPQVDVNSASRQIGSLLLVMNGHAQSATDIDQGTAAAAALQTMAARARENGAAPINGLAINNAYLALGLTKATTKNGEEIASFQAPTDAWVFEYVAPPQAGWAHVSAIAIVNAQTGQVVQFSTDEHN
jgi:hypothetical protein